jgi:hypothetical protein
MSGARPSIGWRSRALSPARPATRHIPVRHPCRSSNETASSVRRAVTGPTVCGRPKFGADSFYLYQLLPSTVRMFGPDQA